jgi:hypothetical protein
MPATSQQQQKLFGLALSVKRGETPRSEASDEVLNIVDTMSEKDIKDFASSSHSGLPKKVESVIRGFVRETFRNKVLGEIVNEAPTRRSKDFFEDSKHGNTIHKLLNGKWDRKKVENYFDKLGHSNDVKWVRILGVIANQVGLSSNKYKTGGELETATIDAIENLYKIHNESINESNQRSNNFFKVNQSGLHIYNMLNGKWDRKKVENYFNSLVANNNIPVGYNSWFERLKWIADSVGIDAYRYTLRKNDLIDAIVDATEKLYKIHTESINEDFIPNVGTVDKFKLKDLLLKNPKVNAMLNDKEKSFINNPKVVVIMHKTKRFNSIFTDGKLELEIDMKAGKVVKPLGNARKEIVSYFSNNESINEAKKKPKDELGARLVKAIDNNISSMYELVFEKKDDIKSVVDTFSKPLLNSINQTLKYNYKPHPTTKLNKIHGTKSNQERIDEFKSELNKFLPMVEKLINKPTKVGVKDVMNAWTRIWNRNSGAEIALAGQSYDSIIESTNSKTKQLDEKLITFSNRAPYGQVVFIAGGAGCFSPDTKIKTENGYKFIKDIQIGDIVYSYNEETKQTELKPVLEVYSYKLDELPGNQKMLELKFDNGVEIHCTENHEFYIDGKWVMAKDIELGAEI